MSTNATATLAAPLDFFDPYLYESARTSLENLRKHKKAYVLINKHLFGLTYSSTSLNAKHKREPFEKVGRGK